MEFRRGAWQWLTILALVLASVTGCGGENPHTDPLAALPGARQTHHPGLRDELARLVAERATPDLFDSTSGPAHAGRSPHPLLRDTLHGILGPAAVARALRRIERVYPPGRFEFEPVFAHELAIIRAEYAAARERYCQVFEQHSLEGGIPVTSGLLADLSLLDHATCYHRLEALEMAQAVADERPADALPRLERLMSLDTRLAAIPHVGARLVAAQLRKEALYVLAAVAACPRSTPEHLHCLQEMLHATLAHWTPDRRAWLGDRVLGLHTYEMVRDNQLLNLLKIDELADMAAAGRLEPFLSAVHQQVDEDQWFYLRAMRRVIDHCDQPYRERAEVIDEVFAELESLRGTTRFPHFADRVLLAGLRTGHRELAWDRARCEAWSLALTAATDRCFTHESIDYVTGCSVRIIVTDTYIELPIGDGSETARVPLITDERG